jgi:uncharacterized membrane protein YfcA
LLFSNSIKIAYYGIGSSFLSSLGLWSLVLMIASIVAGTLVGGSILSRLSEASFRLCFRRLVYAVGVFYLVRGAMEVF